MTARSSFRTIPQIRRRRLRPASDGAGFTLIELLIVVAIIALLVSILLPALSGARRQARLTICSSNMRGIGTGIANYTTDAKSYLGTFSWRPGVQYDAMFPPAASYTEAQAYQATWIVRRFLQIPNWPTIPTRIMARNYSYLVLLDGGYFGDRLPEEAVVCPEDYDAKTWQRNYNSRPPNPVQPAYIWEGTTPFDTTYGAFLALWSTYQAVPCSFSDQTGPYALNQASGSPGYHLLYWVYPAYTQFTNTRVENVLFPSQKVYLFDLFDRHLWKRPIFHAYPFARQQVIMFDGSVSIRKTGDANLGWNPTTPTSPNPTTYMYMPTPGEPPALSPGGSDLVRGYYRWTRRGLRGVDYGGGEVR
jgi:prepilin-type N-terminal cleavage/methylation domain-containing protein